MDISEFLAARYDREQRYAEAAMKAADERDPLGLPGWASVALRVDGRATTAELSTFVAQWEPARVLAEVAAKRKLLDIWQRMHEYTSDDTGVSSFTEEILEQLLAPYGKRAVFTRYGDSGPLSWHLEDVDHSD